MLKNQYIKFFALDEEKQKNIINSGMKEFARKGYENASTNVIVAEAGISKGALFHYFNSKKELYIFLYKYSVDLFVNRIIKEMENLNNDIFERWKEVSFIKLKLIAQYPLLFDFLLSVIKNEDMLKELEPVQTLFMKEFAEDIYKDIDYSLFKEGINIPKALKITWWSLEGFAKEKQLEAVSGKIDIDKLGEDIMNEANEYLDILKKAFYK